MLIVMMRVVLVLSRIRAKFLAEVFVLSVRWLSMLRLKCLRGLMSPRVLWEMHLPFMECMTIDVALLIRAEVPAVNTRPMPMRFVVTSLDVRRCDSVSLWCISLVLSC